MAFNPPTSGTAIPSNPAEPTIEKMKRDRYERDKIDCMKKGGEWDKKTNTCILPGFKGEEDPFDIKLPEQEKVEEKAPRVKDTGFVIKKDQHGETVGFEKNGQTYFRPPGTSDDEWFGIIEKESAKELRKMGIPEGATVSGSAQRKADEAFRIQQLTSQIGQLTPEQLQRIQSVQEAPIDWGQAATAGGAKVIPGLIGGAATGAIAGSVVPGIGTALGAVGGAIAGGLGTFINGIMGNIKSQQRGEIGASMDALTNARTNMMKLSRIVSTDPSKATEAVELYNQQLALVYQARAQTKLEVQGNLNKFMEDGRDILSNYDLFLDEGGQAEIYGMRLRADLSRNIPLTAEEIASWELEE